MDNKINTKVMRSSEFTSSLDNIQPNIQPSKSPNKEITEKVNGTGGTIQCVCCKTLMLTKKIIFRTTKLDGIILFNYIGKGGIGCFYQKKQKFFCKSCFNKYRDIIDAL